MLHTQLDKNSHNWSKTVKMMFFKIGFALSLCTAPFVLSNGKTYAATYSADVSIEINGQVYHFEQPPFILNDTTYIPLRDVSETLGANVWWNGTSKTVGINSSTTNIAFVVGSTTARVNQQKIEILPAKIVANKTMVPIRFLSESLGFHVEWDHDVRTVRIGQSSSVPALSQAYVSGSSHVQQEAEHATVTYINHAVQKGENAWNISTTYGIPHQELLQANQLDEDHVLQVGDILKIPVHNVPVKPTVSAIHGELLDWWSEAQYVFPINSVAKITDIETGKTYTVKRTMGANHADAEPLTSNDARTMLELWGGSYSWTPRAVIVEVDGRKLAAAMHSYPHGDQTITDNGYNGHFCIHFLNSVRHSDGELWADMQTQVLRAAV